MLRLGLIIIISIATIGLLIYVARNVIRAKSFGTSDALGVLGVLVGILLFAITLPKSMSVEDAIRLEHNYKPYLGSHYVSKINPQKNLEENVKENEDAIPYGSILSLDVISQVQDETIKLAPYLIVEVLDIKPMQESNLIVTPRGSGNRADIFEAILSPTQEQRFGAPFVGGGRVSPLQAEQIDSFTLENGEREVFELRFEIVPGYRYKFRVAVLYTYKGKQNTKWISENFEAGAPLLTHLWEADFASVRHFEDRQPPTNVYANLEQRMKEYNRQVEQEPFFTFPSAP